MPPVTIRTYGRNRRTAARRTGSVMSERHSMVIAALVPVASARAEGVGRAYTFVIQMSAYPRAGRDRGRRGWRGDLSPSRPSYNSGN